MAQYQVGSSFYEIPDNISPQQLNEVLTELASKEQPQQQQGTDGALAYSVDKAQQMLGKGVEVAGDLVGSDTVKQFGSDVVAQQDKDIAAGGYKPTYTGSFRETYNKGGIENALGWIVEKSAENLSSGGLAIAGTGLAALTAPFSASAALLIGGGTFAASAAMNTGDSAFEQEEKTGGYDSKVAVGTGIIAGILDKFGAGKVIPTSDLAKLSGQELVERLIKAGHPNAAKNIGKRILKSFGSEGGTETVQEAAIVGSAVTQGGEYTKDELIDRGIDAAVLGGTMGGTTTTAIETAKATGRGVQNVTGMAQEEVTPEVQAARGDFANRLDRIATGNGMNLKNVGKMGSKGAVDAVDNAHTEIASEIDFATDGLNQTNETTLNKRKGDTALVAEKKAKARLAIKNAKNKVKGIVTNDQLAVVEELVGGTTEGQQLLNLMRESNELTALHKAGYVGGLSQYTDLMSPIGGRAGYDTGMIATERMLRPLITGGAAFQTGGASLALQGGIAATGRIVDAMTGRRSRVAKFIKNNRGKSGQQVSAGSSARAKGLAAFRARQAEIERKKREAAEKRRQQQAENARRRAEEDAKADRDREMNIQMYKDGTRQSVGYNPDSPQDILLKGTGMDLRNIEIALAEIVRNYPSSHAYSISASSALKSLRQGGRIEGLSNLIRVINSMVMNGTTQAKQVRQPDDGAINRYRENEAIKRGIEANRAFAQSLIDALDADTSVDSFSKGIIKSKLETYKNDDLGLDPLGRARQELQDAIEVLQANNGNVEKANQYLGQYIARVETQQNARKGQEQPQPDPQPEPQPQPQPDPQPEPDTPLNPDPVDPTYSDPTGGTNDIPRTTTKEPEGGGVDGQGTQSDPEGNGRTDVPDPDQAKRTKKAQQVIFEIGKEGTKYENGIDSMDAVKTLVEAIGSKFVIHDSHASILRASGKRRGEGQLNGFFNSTTNTVHVLNGDLTDLPIESYRSVLQAVGTALHEAGHAMDLNRTGVLYRNLKALTGSRSRQITDGKFELALIEKLLSTKGRKSSKDDLNHPIVREIIALQREGYKSTGTGSLTGEARVRGEYSRGTAEQLKDRERTYFHKPVELIADALMLYMINPKKFKQDAPITAQFLRQVNNADPDLSKVITLHSAPIAALVVVLATLINLQDDKEDEPLEALSA